MIHEQLTSKEATLSVTGLGYVGLPIALALARKLKVIGFDINSSRVEKMQKSIDPSGELDKSEFEGADITFTDNPDDLRQASFHIVAVPTPIDNYNKPNLKPLLAASAALGRVLKKGDYVVFESTVYPGCTEEECVPVLEHESGLKFKEDFMVGYSPERINPGDKEHTLDKIVKVVSGCCEESLENIARVYELVTDAGVHKAPTIRVAEAAKVIENTQRDLNIALMNELSLVFERAGINTFDVLEAAGTKWNFLKFTPGLVGGHCIGVDPYYLTHKAHALGYSPEVILSGRRINDSMGAHVARKAVQLMTDSGKNMSSAKVLVMGATFKENVSDIRNSKVADIVRELKSFGISTDIIDPHASSEQLLEEYGFGLTEEPSDNYDLIIFAVKHKEFLELDEAYFESITDKIGIFIDLKGYFKGKIGNLKYWSL